MSDVVLVEHIDGISIITINRPKVRNAITNAVAVGMAAAVDELDADDSLTIGIITGAGGTFCSGMDLKAFLKASRSRSRDAASPGCVDGRPASR